MTFHKMMMMTALTVLALVLLSCDDKTEVTGEEEDTGGQDTGTGDAPAEVIDDLTVLADKVFFWDMEDRHWATPRGSGPEFGMYVPDMLFQIVSAGEDGALEFLLTTADADGVQDECTATASMSGAITDNPTFETTAMDFASYASSIDSDGVETIRAATMYDMIITGQFVEGGTRIQRGTMYAIIDFREIYELFHLIPDSTPELICQEVPDYGAECMACPSDNEPYCIQLGAELITAEEEAAGTVVTEVATGCY